MGAVAASVCGDCGGGTHGSAAKKASPAPPPQQADQLLSSALNVDDFESGGKREPEPKVEPPQVEVIKPPPRPAPTIPITLDVLQGDWVNSMGAKINVEGTLVSLNGMPMKVHPVQIDDDGLVTGIGKIWQLKGWLEDEQIEFKEAPSREVMEFARSVTWKKADEANMKAWTEQMNSLGYSGSAQDPLKRGVEGCCPGTCDAKAREVKDDVDRDKAELALLNRLVEEYRIPGMFNIPPSEVIPDFSNRGHTGLSVEHVHYLAKSFMEKGFIKRSDNKGHDIPVLVKESTSSDLGEKSVANWKSKLADEPGFPPQSHYDRLFAKDTLYTSLGNGHFNQALNLVSCRCKSIYKEESYRVGGDAALREAIDKGVEAIVLRNEIPLRDRETISRLLNSKREYKWTIRVDGSVDIKDAQEDTTQVKQFEAMSKVLDAVELNCLVRAELGVKDSHRIGQ